jgi:class 3 adenylate cyclase
VIVKTMGDAVMAAFREPREAVLAAADALRAFELFRASHEHGASIGLKLGVYAGPCYVVSANGALDYFGQTVNVASRVQHLAESGQIVVPVELFAELKEQGTEQEKAPLCEYQRFEARVKGVETPLALVRAVLATTARVADASD